jgi:hypothetical protein
VLEQLADTTSSSSRILLMVLGMRTDRYPDHHIMLIKNANNDLSMSFIVSPVPLTFSYL